MVAEATTLATTAVSIRLNSLAGPGSAERHRMHWWPPPENIVISVKQNLIRARLFYEKPAVTPSKDSE